MRLFTTLTLSFVFFIHQASFAQSADTLEKIKQVEQNLVGTTMIAGDAPYTLQERMQHYHVKGLSIAVIHNYKMEWAKGYGFADEELKIPVTGQTLFQAASISKSLNAIGILKLAQEKKVDLYVDINDYLSNGKRTTNKRDSYSLMNSDVLNWKFPYDSIANGRKVTIANLLSHTGGLTVHGFGGYEKGVNIPNIKQVLDGEPPANSKKVRSVFAPGLKYQYSGGGITISQLIIMNMMHEPYDKYMQEEVLMPLDMTSSTYSQFIPRDKRSLLATGYTAEGRAIPGKYHIYPEQAAAGLWTNPTDLSKYIIETQLAYDGRSQKVLNKQWTRTRLTPYIDKSAALGVFITDIDSTKYFTHSGANEGFRGIYYGSLEDGNGLVIMVNSDNDDILPEIVNSIAKVYQFKGLYKSKVVKALAFSATQLQAYAGSYEIKPGLVLNITSKGDQLYGQVTGQQKYTLFPLAENKFYLNVADTQIEFIKDDKGDVIKAIVYQNGPHEALKIK